MNHKLIDILIRIFDTVKTKPDYMNTIKECESYIPSKQDNEIIRTKKLIPEIEYVKGKINNMDRVILPELKKREAAVLNMDMKELKEGEAPAEAISTIFDHKMMAERNRKIWGEVLSKYNRDRTTLITGDYHMNPNLLQGIVNAHTLKNTSRIFLLACSEDVELNEYLETIVDPKEVIELSNAIIDFDPLFLHDMELKMIKRDFNTVRLAIDLLTRTLKENVEKNKEEANTDNYNELISKIDKVIDLATINKEEEDALSTEEFIGKIDTLLVSATEIQHDKLKPSNLYIDKLVFDYHDTIVNKAKLIESSASLKIFANSDMVAAFREMKNYNDSLKDSKIKNAKRHNSFLNSSLVLYAAATMSSPTGANDIDFLRKSLLSLFFYTRLVPNENFRTAALYTI